MNCKIKSHKKGKGFVSGLITTGKRLWSIFDKSLKDVDDLVHTEIMFSERYGSISFSATLEDGCKCARFKLIKYSHPERWTTEEVPMTDEQEDAAFAKACRLADVYRMEMADVTMSIKQAMDIPWLAQGFAHYEIKCFYGPHAVKYDTLGVILCNLSRRRILPSNPKRYWCTEIVTAVIQKAYPDFNGPADIQVPWTLPSEWAKYREGLK